MKYREKMPALVGATSWINGELTQEELIGKPTLVYFWSISCMQCQSLMPKVKVLMDNALDRINIVLVHMPRNNFEKDTDYINDYIQEYGINTPVFVDTDYKLSNAYENPFTPAFYLFDKDGKLHHFQTGGSQFFLLLKRINRLTDR
jgi:thiol-disulfide isomerase/thioredoxin